MKLYVEPMDAVVVEVTADGRVRLDDQKEPALPTFQERRAILNAAGRELEDLRELIEILEKDA